MNRKRITLLLLLMLVIFLTGCNMRTIDQLYCLPKRSEDYLNLKSAMDSAMAGLEYSAPLSGENQQTVQMADLNGDGNQEYLLFAKGSDEKPLKIFIFTFIDEEYVLADTIEGAGNAFDQVHYVRFTGQKGYDLVVGRQMSDQLARPVSVYTMNGTSIEQILTTSYSKFVCSDLDGNGKTELLVLRSGDDPAQNGIAELYHMTPAGVERSKEVPMSEPADHIKRIMSSRLHEGIPAVYVASDVDGTAIITDVYAFVNDEFTNVSLSNESGTSVQTLRNYYVYADDIDGDGVLELPSLIPMQSVSDGFQEEQYLIRWYSMTAEGAEVDKMYTYHNFLGGWFLELDQNLANNVMVKQLGNSYVFSMRKEDGVLVELMTVYVFTGHLRDEQAVSDNRFVLYRNESTVYAAHLGVESAAYNLSKDSLMERFHLIVQDWKSAET